MRILDSLVNNSDCVALIVSSGSGDQRLTYRELDSWSSGLAMQMRAAGLGREKPVGLLAPSSLEYVATLLACWKIGAMAVPLQTAHPEAELRYIVEDARIEHIFHHPRAGELAAKLGVSHLHPITQTSGEFTRANRDPRDASLMIYTSGTTNRPKGVVTAYSGLEAQIQSLLTAWRWSSTDRTLNVLPLHHVHGVVNILCCSLAAGASCEMAEKFTSTLVWDRIASGAINVFMAVPTIYAKLVQDWEARTPDERERLSQAANRMRLMVSGSAALPEPLFQAWERITGQRLLERYGMTELGMALSNPYEGPRVPGSVGRPLPGVDVRLVSESGEIVTGHDEPGEIQVRGTNVFREYFGKPEATAATFTSDGWFKTGDVAVRDPQGAYRILGRSSQDIIKSGGYKISALEIESVLLEHPEVAECAVVGVQDPMFGERVGAAVVVKGGAAAGLEERLSAFLKGRLAHYKVPSRWKMVESLPRNAMGKVMKPQVRQIFV